MENPFAPDRAQQLDIDYQAQQAEERRQQAQAGAQAREEARVKATPAPAAPDAPAVPDTFDPEVEVKGFEGRWTRERVKKIRGHAEDDSPDGYIKYSQGMGDRSLDALDGTAGGPRTNEKNLAQHRLNFRRWADANNVDDQMTSGTESRIIGTWADSLYPPKELTNKQGELTGKRQRDARATQLINGLAGEARTKYWSQGLPQDSDLNRTLDEMAADDPEFKKKLDNSRNPKAPEVKAEPVKPPTPNAGVIRSTGDIALEGVAGLAKGLVSIGDFANRGLQFLGTGMDQKSVEGVYKGVEYLKEQGQSAKYLEESKAFSEALSKVDVSVVADIGRALARGDRATADKLAAKVGIGDAFSKFTTPVILGTILGGVGEFAGPLGAGGLAARGAAKLVGAGGNALARSGQAGAIAGATLAPTASGLTELGAEVRQATGNDAKADSASAILSKQGAVTGAANLAGALAGPAAAFSRIIPRVDSVPAITNALGRVSLGAAAGAGQGAGTIAGGNIARSENGIAEQNMSGPAILGGVLGGVFNLKGDGTGKGPVVAERGKADDGTSGAKPPETKAPEAKVTSNDPQEAAAAAIKSALGDPPEAAVLPEAARGPGFAPEDPRSKGPTDVLANALAESTVPKDALRTAAEPIAQGVPSDRSFAGIQAAAARVRAATGFVDARVKAMEATPDLKVVEAPTKAYERRGEKPEVSIDEATARKVQGESDALAARVGARIEMSADRTALPPDIAGQFTPGTKAITVVGEDGRSIIYVDRSMHANEADLTQTMNHEVAVHASLPKLLGNDAMTSLLSGLYAARDTDPRVAATFKEVRKLYPEMNDPATLATEVLARLNDGSPVPEGSMTARVMAATRVGLETLGLRSPSGNLDATQFSSLLKAITSASDNAEARYRVQAELAPRGSQQQRQTIEKDQLGIVYSKGQELLTSIYDRLIPVHDVGKAAEAAGVPNRISDLAITAGVTRGQDIAAANQRYVEPVYKALREVGKKYKKNNGQSDAAFNQVAIARHGLERNNHTYNLFSKLNDTNETKRNGLLEDVWAGIRTSENMHRELTAIVDAEKGITDREAWRGSGLNNQEVRNTQAAVARDPFLSAIDREVYPKYREMMQKKTEAELKSGIISIEELRTYGFTDYVPMRGGDAGSANMFVRKGSNSGYVPDRSAAGRNDFGAPTNILGESVALTRQAASELSSGALKREMARVMQETNDFGYVLDPKQAGKPYMDATGVYRFDVPEGIKKQSYENVFGFVDEAGNRRFMVVGTEAAAKALGAVGNPEPLKPFARGVQQATGLLSQLFTVKNPSFWVPALSRDLQGNTMRLATNAERFGLANSEGPAAASNFLGSAANNLSPVSDTGMLIYKHAYGSPEGKLKTLDEIKAKNPELHNFMTKYAITFSDQFATPRGEGKTLFERLGDTRAGEKAGTWIDRLFAQQDVHEIAHRFAFYKTLRDRGVDELAAGRHTIELTNFAQRSDMSQMLNILYPFSNTITAGAQRSFSGLFRNGVPVRYERMPDGTQVRTTSFVDMLKEVNKTQLMTNAAVGFIATAASLAALSAVKDSAGVSLDEKVSASALARGWVLPVLDSAGMPTRTPYADSEGMFGQGLGSLLAGMYHGIVTPTEAGINMANIVDRVFLPAFKPRSEFSDAPNQNIEDVLKLKLLGLTPALIRPLMESAINTSFTGAPLDNRGQTRMASGGPVTLRGVEATRDSTAPQYKGMADALRGGPSGAGGLMDVSGESIRNLALTYLGYPMRLLDQKWNAESRAARDGKPSDGAWGEALSRIFVQPEMSPRGYYFRERQQAEAPFEAMRRVQYAATQEDRGGKDPSATKRQVTGTKEDGTTARSQSWTRGTREKAILEDNPALVDYLEFKKGQDTERRVDAKNAQGGQANRLKIARNAGNNEVVQAETASREEKDQRAIVYLKALGKAQADWRAAGSDPKQWPAFKARSPQLRPAGNVRP